ncbi:MAG: fibronectin type III domain-containing protein [Demequina sp.]
MPGRVAAATLLTLIGGVLVASPSAAAVTGASSTTTETAVAGTTVPLAGLSVTASTSEELVSVIVSTDVGTVSVAVGDSGATLDYGYAPSGAEVAFSGTTTAVNGALGTVELTTAESAKGTNAEISIVARPEGGVVYSPSTQHFYEYVPSGAITWTQARAAARDREYLGQAGYLATVPNAEINNLITSRISGAQNVWLGGIASYNIDGYPRVWRWDDGPRAGDTFTRCWNQEGPCYFVDNAGLYSNWSGGEPNNANWNEPHLVTNWGSFSGLWNDLPDYSDSIGGYVVEYGDLRQGATSFTGLASAESTVALQGVPNAVVDLTAAAGVGEATASWAAPANVGGSPVTNYGVSVTPAGGDVTDCVGLETSCTITGLTSGATYTVTVIATNALGDSATRSTTVTPGTVPGAPVGPLDQILVGEPYSDEVTATGFPAPTFSVTDGALPAGLVLNAATGAITGTATTSGAWSVEITATNVHGAESTTFSGTVGQVPAITTTTVGPFTWGVPVDINLAADGFPTPDWDAGEIPSWLTLDEDGRLSGTPDAVGEYDLTVTATNIHGADTETFTLTVNATVSDAPAIGDVTPGNGTLTVEVTAPTADGGTPVTGYEYTLDGGDTWQSAVEEDGVIAIIDLDNGTSYTVQVRAINEAGPSAPSASATATPITTPDAPVLVSVVPGNGAVTIEFDEGAFDGGSEITRFEYTLDGGATWTATDAVAGEEFVVGGLDNGTEYEVAVRAVNAAGPSAASATDAVTPFTVADAPSVTSVVESDGALTARFAAPDFNGGSAITGYEYSIDGGDTWVVTSAVPGDDLVIDELTNGTRYDVTVRALNAAGAGDSSAPHSATPRMTADAPAITSVTPGNGTITIAFDAPAFDGGAAITGYQYTLDGGATWETATEDDGVIVIDGLTNGREYTAQIRALNAAGASAPSGEHSATPFTSPGSPSVTAAEPGNGRATLEFAAPAFDGGSPITGYEYSVDGGTTWTSAPAGPGEAFTVYGLTNGTQYTVVTRAVNADGPGAVSEPVLVTPVRGPVTIPGQPAVPVLEPGAGAGVVIVDGAAVDSTTDTRNGGWTVTGGGVSVSFAAFDANGGSIVASASTGSYQVYRDGSVLVGGSGFAPGSTVDVWLLSEPWFLGEVTVNDDGTFSAMFALPEGLDLGSDTLQVNGLSADGESVSINTGIDIVDPPVVPIPVVDEGLSDTGADLRPAGAAALLLALGLGLALMGRRRQLVSGAERAS